MKGVDPIHSQIREAVLTALVEALVEDASDAHDYLDSAGIPDTDPDGEPLTLGEPLGRCWYVCIMNEAEREYTARPTSKGTA